MHSAWTAAEEMLTDLMGPRHSGTADRVAHDHLVQYGRSIIKRIAEIAEAVGQQAGVGGMETAGHIVSYLAENPAHFEPLLKGGIFELPPDWVERGQLTWRAENGQIVHPEVARRARVIKKMEQGNA
jgi:hypothetical protein